MNDEQKGELVARRLRRHAPSVWHSGKVVIARRQSWNPDRGQEEFRAVPELQFINRDRVTLSELVLAENWAASRPAGYEKGWPNEILGLIRPYIKRLRELPHQEGPEPLVVPAQRRMSKKLRFDYDLATEPEVFGMTREPKFSITSLDPPKFGPEPSGRGPRCPHGVYDPHGDGGSCELCLSAGLRPPRPGESDAIEQKRKEEFRSWRRGGGEALERKARKKRVGEINRELKRKDLDDQARQKLEEEYYQPLKEIAESKTYQEVVKIFEADAQDKRTQRLAALEQILSPPEVQNAIGEQGCAVLGGLVEHKPHRELAAALGVSKSQIDVIFCRAIQALRRQRSKIRPLVTRNLSESENTWGVLDDLTERDGTDHEIDPVQEVWEHDPEDEWD